MDKEVQKRRQRITAGKALTREAVEKAVRAEFGVGSKVRSSSRSPHFSPNNSPKV